METVTRLRAGTTQDSRGDDVEDWDNTTDLTLYPDAVEPVSSTEDNDNRQAVITGFRVYFNRTRPDVTAGDRMVLRGLTWAVDGRPADWRSPFGTGQGGLVVALRSVTG